jgi:hypothetical protein
MTMATADTASTEITFQTDEYGAIFPLPLLAGMTPEEALDKLVDDSAAMGHPFDPPTERSQYYEEMLFRGALHVHQQRLPDAMAGEMDVPEAMALRRAVLEQHHPMSLRPLGMEVLNYQSFAPVLKYLGDGQWQVGLKDYGRVEVFEEPDVAQAVRRAQQTFKQWADQDDEGWMEAAEEAMKEHPRSLFHHYWAHHVHEHEVWNRGDGYRLVLQGSHNRFRLELPGDALRVFKTTRVRATHLTDAIARHAGVEPDYPAHSMVMEWLVTEGMAFPDMDDPSHWKIGNVKVKVDRDNGHIVLITGEGDDRQGYLIVREKDRRGHPRLALYAGDQRGRPDKTKTLAKTAWEPPFAQWMQDLGRTVLSMWFIYDAKLGGMAEEEN